jgi:Lipopolysaccharide-assembly
MLAACGYHVSGHADALPPAIHTLYIPAFSNLTTKYKLADSLPEALAREFISRTRYRIVSNETDADAVLHGSVNTVNVYGSVVDPTTGRASTVQISVMMQVSLVQRSTGTVLYTRPNFEWHTQYEIAGDPRAYFDESGVALDRLSKDVARSIVSAILEKF